MNIEQFRKITQQLELQDITSELENFYENAGFHDYYDRVLISMSEGQLREYFVRTFFEYQNELSKEILKKIINITKGESK